MTAYNDTPIVESNDLIKTDKGSMVKKFSYVVFGILPATFFSFILFIFMWSITNGGAAGYYFLALMTSITGTIGLYIITFTNEHNPKIAFRLLLVGQMMMGLVIGYLLIITAPWREFSLNAFLSFLVDEPYEFTTTIIMSIILLGPIAVALHYQLTVYRPWRVRQNKLDKESYMQSIEHFSDVKAD